MPFGIAAIAAPIVSGIFGANAASKAAKAQEEAAQQGIALQRQEFDQTQQNLSPWMQAGGNALQSLQQLLGIGGGGQGAGSPLLSMLGIGPGGQPGTATTPFQTSPGYQFAKQEGLDSITNQAAGRGGMGGNTLKKLEQYGTGVANQDYGNYFNQLRSAWNDLLGGVGGVSKQGEGAAEAIGQFGANAATHEAESLTQAGNAKAAGIIGSNNALFSGINSAIGGAKQLYNSPSSGGSWSNLFPGLAGLFGDSSSSVDNSQSFGSNYSYNPMTQGYGGDPNSAGGLALQQMGFFNPLPRN